VLQSKKVHLKSGDTLFRTGDPPDSAYLVESGFLEVSSGQEGNKLVLASLRSGDILGEMAVIDNNSRTATVTATTDCILLEIDREQFAERLLRSDPIIRSLLEGLIRRYRNALSTLRGEQITGKGFAQTTVLKKVTVEKIRLETQLKEALDNHALDLRFQAIYDIQQKLIVGYEALVRWNHPEHGYISPTEFIALAEETNVAVNISIKQIQQPGFIDAIRKCISNHGLNESSLVLEITESQTAAITEIKNFLESCHKHKLKVALDDFGTGYSNMTQLHELNFNTIKIDQAFTRELGHNPRSLILVENIIGMCRSLGSKVLIEGIESQEMLDMATKFNCNYAQGYFIGKPETIDKILANLKN